MGIVLMCGITGDYLLLTEHRIVKSPIGSYIEADEKSRQNKISPIGSYIEAAEKSRQNKISPIGSYIEAVEKSRQNKIIASDAVYQSCTPKCKKVAHSQYIRIT
ncbi:hypothetical protein AVEN_154302-1 [Araneus ventricosus]|uniref:Uncharacterized protein n=1 Tax=Araneus ventricosus TaxID=182803 RepID=A0A4Y2KIK4_ARAVE|nr:hypothetical protein AVEN_242634-1 [Araneus ventricosus]GBN02491.1 hypothetical protein AVEN_154302-1 [Araneus ventricosus]